MGGGRPPLIARPNRPNGPLLPGQPRGQMHSQGGPHQNQHAPWGQGYQGSHPRPGHMHPGPRPNMPLMRMPGNRGPVPGQSPLLRNPGPPMDHQRPPHPPQMQEWNDHQSHGHPNNMNMGSQQNAMPPRPPGMLQHSEKENNTCIGF